MKKERKKTIFLFTIYLVLLIWIILMKTEFSIAAIYRMRSLNLIPLEGTAVRNNQLDYQEIYLNILIFIPFGLYLSIIQSKWSFFQKLFLIFLVSLSFEALQYYFMIGATDITDLIGNTFGGFLGLFIYSLLTKLIKGRKRREQLLNRVGGLGTLLFFLGIFISFYFNPLNF